MGTIALHRLTDWPVFRHLRPLLDAVGVPAATLDRWHYFFAAGAIEKSPFAGLPEKGALPEHEEALLAVSAALAALGYSFLGAKGPVKETIGFHWSASKEELADRAKNAGHDVVFVNEALALDPRAEERGALAGLYAKNELASLRKMLKEAFEPASAKLASRYIEDGGPMPALARRRGAGAISVDFRFAFADWTEGHDRVLDVFVVATERNECPRWYPISDAGEAYDDAAGRLRDALVARGVPERVIFDALCTPNAPGSGRVAFGHGEWPSRHALLASWFARLDEVAAMGPGRAAALFKAQIGFPHGLRVLAGMVADRWARASRFERLDLESLATCTYLDRHHGGEAFDADAARAYRSRVLAEARPALAHVLAAAERGSPPVGAERAALAALARRAAEGEEATLLQLGAARERGWITDEVFSTAVVSAFGRALAAGFRSGPHAFGDHDGFMAAAPAVGAADPDLCLRGFVALAKCFNENGLKTHLSDWDRVLPKKGYGAPVLAEVGAHFSSPAERSAAKILGKLLVGRGIAVTRSAPPPLDDFDHTFEVGTDVAHLLIGSFDAVEAIGALEDPDGWPAAIKRRKCVGLQTGGDGGYVVRVVGATGDPERKAKGAAHVASFPLEITGDALTVSGIVGAGGTPTVPFPSGVYSADVFASGGGRITVVVTATKAPPTWSFKNALPRV